ncbi:hypothetical protein [Frankia sp. R82]|uniref:hypothetical protein n=1 Tax=Frankia sp. R82 TaxID=2950553 RepID=UPI0020430E86|nr:hypothetical protein [Frankia sp. R82]MCM3884144.1 hypothetical protein [Frankia sp. R82]
MWPDDLLAALRAQARGVYTAEAAVELLAGWNNGYWIRRAAANLAALKVDYSDDPDEIGDTPMASIDWRALNPNRITASSGERAILVIACSLGGGRPVDLRDCLTSLGLHGIDCVTAAIVHAGGRRPDGV